VELKNKNKNKRREITIDKLDAITFYQASSFLLQRLDEKRISSATDIMLETKIVGSSFFGESYDSFSFFARSMSLMAIMSDEKNTIPIDNFFEKYDVFEGREAAKYMTFQLAIYPIIDGVFVPEDFLIFMKKNLNDLLKNGNLEEYMSSP